MPSSMAIAMQRRNDKQQRTYFRSERFFNQNGSWYFAAREGEFGPYASRAAADAAMQRFVAEKVHLQRFQQSREKELRLKPLRDPHERVRAQLDERVKSLNTSRRVLV